MNDLIAIMGYAGEAVGGGSKVWLLPKSKALNVAYHVPVVLNPPQTLKPQLLR